MPASASMRRGISETELVDAKALAALRKGATLTVNTFGDADSPIAFPPSLKGFSLAFDRVAVLAH
jgi:invasion protein IalB